MATFTIYQLHFHSPLHVADKHEAADVSLKTVQSDTLMAALFSCLAKTGDDIPANGDLGFIVSSMFPYYQKNADSEPEYFLPLPMAAELAHIEDPSMAKKIKKVKWASTNLYYRILSGERNIYGTTENEFSYIHGEYLTNMEMNYENDDFIISNVIQRAKIEDRTGQDDALPYFVDRVFFKDYSGLYFLVVGDTSKADKAVALLAEEGIGTDRNVGFGRFSFSKGQIDIDTPENADHQVALSVLIPESETALQEMLDSEAVAYDFERRGGWITSFPYNTLRKDAIYSFLPGSVFKCSGKSTMGKIVDLAPSGINVSHPVWRDGRAIMLPIRRNVQL